MNILVACEESQAVTKELRRLGHEAYSCDIIDQSGGHPEWHIMQDVLPLINGDCSFHTTDGAEHSISGPWDLLIAHPPCTYLSNAGARWLWAGGKLNEQRYNLGLQAKRFFMAFFNANCARIAVENPIPSTVYDMPPYTQIVQPYEYGHPWSKKTCLWLKGLEPLQPTKIVTDYRPFCSSGSYSGTHDPKYRGASRRGGSAKSRSKTFPGIAKAMAEQWAGPCEGMSITEEEDAWML
jgi:hypothetical protein